jgi:hypothetical protein
MTVEATFSKYKRNNFLIGIAICILLAAWFAYDGYFNEEFKSKNTNDNGRPNSTLVINQKSPPFFLGAAIVLGAWLYAVKDRKIVAAENEIALGENDKIPYSSIEKIDKTYFDSKGYFIITCRKQDGSRFDRKISNRTYDNLTAVLDETVAKIS